MTAANTSPASVYRCPRYYAIGYRWNTEGECEFLEACLATYRNQRVAKILDMGCGAGRHLFELARRGHQVTGFDLRPEMVDFVKEEARTARLPVSVRVGDLREVPVEGTFDLAICLMDTFRFLLTNTQIRRHLERVGHHLVRGGLYVTDFWIPTRWDHIANEVHQWEQTEGATTVRVVYLQHPESIDPVHQTFEDELVFTVEEDGLRTSSWR